MTDEIKQTYSRDTEVLSTLILAIETRNKVAFTYHKDVNTNGIRTLLPHCIYWNKDNTKVMLDAFQVQGDTSSGIKTFKQFDTAFIRTCIILDDKFEIEQQYNATSDRYSNRIIGVIE